MSTLQCFVRDSAITQRQHLQTRRFKAKTTSRVNKSYTRIKNKKGKEIFESSRVNMSDYDITNLTACKITRQAAEKKLKDLTVQGTHKIIKK